MSAGDATAGPGLGRAHDLAAEALALLSVWVVGLVLGGLSAAILMDPPEGSVDLSRSAAAVTGSCAALCVVAGLWRASATRLPSVVVELVSWVPCAASAGALVGLSTLRLGSGYAGPWPAETVSASLLVFAVAARAGVRAAILVAVPLILGSLTESFSIRAQDALIRTPLAGVLSATQVALAAVVSSYIVAGFARGSRSAVRMAALADRNRALEEATRAARAADAEVVRTLHDTALNTLEAVARHGDRLSEEDVRLRCEQDHEQLVRWRRGMADTDLEGLPARLAEHGRSRGLTVDLGPVGSAPAGHVPPAVVAALGAAAREALTNVSTHAGTDSARVMVDSGSGTCRIEIEDRGVGIDHVDRVGGGFGLSHSMVARVQEVGGTVAIHSPPGEGTTVRLEWHSQPGAADIDLVDLNSMVARVATWAGLAGSVIALAVIALGWSSFARPWLAVVGVLVPVVVLVDLRRRWSATGSLTVADAVVTASAYVVATFAGLLADRYCASVLGERIGMLSALVMVVVVLLLTPQALVAVGMVGAVVVTHLAVAQLWQAAFVVCGSGTRSTGLVITALLVAVGVFARVSRSLSRAQARSRRQAIDAEVRRQGAERLRGDQQRWARHALSSAEHILRELAQGAADPRSRAVREECAREAAFLRALLGVGEAPDPVRVMLRAWLTSLHDAGFLVVLRGSVRDLALPDRVVADVERIVAHLAAGAGRGEVSMNAWSDAEWLGLALQMPAATSAPGHPLAGAEPAVGWVDRAGERLTVVWEWDPSGAIVGAEGPLVVAQGHNAATESIVGGGA